MHHARIRRWFTDHGRDGWATCSVTESGFVRVSSNPHVLLSPIGVEAARGVLRALTAVEGHRFLVDDVSAGDEDVPAATGYRRGQIGCRGGVARSSPTTERSWSGSATARTESHPCLPAPGRRGRVRPRLGDRAGPGRACGRSDSGYFSVSAELLG